MIPRSGVRGHPRIISVDLLSVTYHVSNVRTAFDRPKAIHFKYLQDAKLYLIKLSYGLEFGDMPSHSKQKQKSCQEIMREKTKVRRDARLLKLRCEAQRSFNIV
jgi:hypothetical protein